MTSAAVQQKAAHALSNLAAKDDNKVTIAAAGAIPPLVQLLRLGSAAEVQQHAAGALINLALNADNKVTIAAAGAIPLLVQLLRLALPTWLCRPGSADLPKRFAARALQALGYRNAENRAAITAAGDSVDVDVLEEFQRLVI
ncbi:hypothetical protein FOA52_001984 [Chlamydomonas sp. UWO 241]|nr:hypothetical protein FOA52_001984 [Chlamydomonas sp. UWO 241]